MCGGGGGAPPPPPPSATEEQLRQKQLDLLNEQQKEQEAFAPFQASAYGYNRKSTLSPEDQATLDVINHNLATVDYRPTDRAVTEKQRDDILKKSVISYEKTPERIAQEKQLADLQTLQLDTSTKSNKAINDYLDSLNSPEAKAAQAKEATLTAQQQDIALQQGERQKLALEGKLPVSRGTTDRKTEDFAILKENLARSGNNIIGDDPSTAYSLSSPGTQALDLFNRRYGAIESQERQGTLDSSAQTYLQSVGLSGDIGNRTLSNAGSTANPGGYASTSSAFNLANPGTNRLGLAQGYGGAAQPYAQDRNMMWQNSVNNAQIAQQDRAGWLNLAGSVVGAGTSAAFLMSTKKAKKKIVKEGAKEERAAMKSLSGTPIYNWKYKNESDASKSHVGTLTEEAPPEIVSKDGRSLDVASYFGLLTHGIKDINRRLVRLEGK